VSKEFLNSALRSSILFFLLSVTLTVSLSFTVTLTLSGFLGSELTDWVSLGFTKSPYVVVVLGGLPPFLPFSLDLSALCSYFFKSLFNCCLIGSTTAANNPSNGSGFLSFTYSRTQVKTSPLCLIDKCSIV
jgi:4-amino-4-deoxy-L-arabinose transferase-like glycosyltransferase